MHASIRPEVVLVRTLSESRVASSILWILVISLAIASAACSGGETNTNANTAPPTESANSAPLQKVPGGTSYSVDTINNQSLPKGSVVVNSATTPKLIIAGWAVDGQAKAPAGGVIFSIDGKSEMTATYGGERPDVAAALKEPNYKMSGFGIAIPTQSLEKGKHTIVMKILTSDKKGYYEPNQKLDIEIQ
jgi:hypothetical protein